MQKRFVILRNLTLSALVIGGYLFTSPKLFPQGCTVPAAPTTGPCAQQFEQCENATLTSCLNKGGSCATCNVTKNYSACSTTYNQCIAGEKSDCRSGWDCPGVGNSALCTYYPNETCQCSCVCYGEPNCPNPVCQPDGTWICDSPIVIDSAGEGFHLTSAASGVYFDLWADGLTKKFSWTDPGFHNGWLALDRNGNGVIDNGSELFGSATPQPTPADGASPNGFNALAVYDSPANGGNGDGFIDANDAIYKKLLIWQDDNHNGVSEPSELKSLQELDVYRIDLQYELSNRVDQFGNAFHYRARIWDKGGQRRNRWAWDVYLLLDK